MDKQDRDRRDIIEGLWLLRACYPRRSDYDTRPTLGVDDAIAYGEKLLHESLRERSSGGVDRDRAA